jgi:thymidylate synthase (FAD)
VTVYVLSFSHPDGQILESKMKCDMSSEPMEDIIEFAGRTCYQSYHKPNEATSSNKAYMANILAQGHESVLEHSSVSFYVEGYSRNMLLELERHRHLSFSVESQRFVDAFETPYIVPPALRGEYEGYRGEKVYRKVEKALQSARAAYAAIEQELSDLPRKQRREAARSILPGGLETRFVVTGNLRAWRDVLKKRWSVHADAEIRDFASVVLELLKDEAPNVFQDFPDTPFD